jgi:hypothetical protein
MAVSGVPAPAVPVPGHSHVAQADRAADSDRPSRARSLAACCRPRRCFARPGGRDAPRHRSCPPGIRLSAAVALLKRHRLRARPRRSVLQRKWRPSSDAHERPASGLHCGACSRTTSGGWRAGGRRGRRDQFPVGIRPGDAGCRPPGMAPDVPGDAIVRQLAHGQDVQALVVVDEAHRMSARYDGPDARPTWCSNSRRGKLVSPRMEPHHA